MERNKKQNNKFKKYCKISNGEKSVKKSKVTFPLENLEFPFDARKRERVLNSFKSNILR